MVQKGGKRPGAGRPKSDATIRTQLAREQLCILLEKEVTGIFHALLLKAQDGDVQAARELFDRAWGKAPQSVDMNVQGRPILILDATGGDTTQ